MRAMDSAPGSNPDETIAMEDASIAAVGRKVVSGPQSTLKVTVEPQPENFNMKVHGDYGRGRGHRNPRGIYHPYNETPPSSRWGRGMSHGPNYDSPRGRGHGQPIRQCFERRPKFPAKKMRSNHTSPQNVAPPPPAPVPAPVPLMSLDVPPVPTMGTAASTSRKRIFKETATTSSTKEIRTTTSPQVEPGQEIKDEPAADVGEKTEDAKAPQPKKKRYSKFEKEPVNVSDSEEESGDEILRCSASRKELRFSSSEEDYGILYD